MEAPMLERTTERFVGKKELCNIVVYDKDRNVISECKGLLNISRATLDRWRERPDFPKAHNPGGQPKWWLPDILGWMKSQ
jgi:predicted DNA-binding transcriptional regulator AlpA